ncbi:MAG: four helix bundle protein [Deltaproteobacteria bacterium]
MTYYSFEELEVWQKAYKLAVRIYRLLKGCRDYGLRDQMTRASVSIASNIAEGAERDSVADFVRFLHIAKGSAAELKTQLYIACDVNIIPESKKDDLINDIENISKMLHGLIKALKKDSKTRNLKPKTYLSQNRRHRNGSRPD